MPQTKSPAPAVVSPPGTKLWVRMRTLHSASRGEWTYRLVDRDDYLDREQPDSLLETLAAQVFSQDNDSGGENFRGAEAEIIPRPPLRWLENEAERNRAALRCAVDYGAALYRAAVEAVRLGDSE